MGSPKSEVERDPNETRHRVKVGGFYMGQYEVTQAEYEAVMGANPSYWKGPSLPVENVSWYDAVEYCNKRSEKEGLTPAYTIDKTRVDRNNTSTEWDRLRWTVIWNQNTQADPRLAGYRLPTEAEWEYTCRAGTTGPFSMGKNITVSQANYDGRYPYNGNAEEPIRGTTTVVGSFAPNPWGLYDMHGNVFEWCWDWKGDYSRGAQSNPVGASSGSYRVERGGSLGHGAIMLRSASRSSLIPAYGERYTGFRVVRPWFIQANAPDPGR